jgi:hypothetical protein
MIAAALSLCLPLSASAQAPAPPAEAVEVSTVTLLEVSSITVTAPRLRTGVPPGTLKAVRAGGVGVAAGGLGILAYSVIFEATGPVGWAAGLLFFGGMTAYLSHRQLHGHDDFSPDEARRSAPAPSRP